AKISKNPGLAFQGTLLLENEATKMLCVSKYPTLNTTLLVYTFLIQHLYSAFQSLYDQAQIKQPANQMIQNIYQYLHDALKKPAYICSMILDPKFKITFWKNHEPFIFQHSNLRVFTEIFQTVSKTTTISHWKSKSFFSLALYQPLREIDGMQGFHVLSYLATQQKGFPNLSLMAFQYLSIPATSVASGQVFQRML
ncbi:hypothetical protein VP01_576g2, partial [Puccinia sorghi]